MKQITKEIQKIKYDPTASDIIILAVSFIFTALIAYGSRRLFPAANLLLFYAVGGIFLFYILRKELLKSFSASKNKQQKKNLLILGSGKHGQFIAGKIISENNKGINLKKIITEDNNIEIELNAIMIKGGIEEIFISVDTADYNEIFRIIDMCTKYHVTVKLSSELFKIIAGKVHSETYCGIPVIDVTSSYRVRYYDTIKRIIDIMIAVSGLIILSPLILIIAFLIKLTSRGPVIYSQKRVGLNGKLFSFYKFRSMIVNDGEDEKRKAMMLDFMVNNNACKVIDEDRVTSIGKIIRKTSLDELPQLYNVIRGDMSIVGPRPSLRYEYETYQDWQKRRVNGMPGCTGIWQVSGRSNVSFNDSIILDLYYLMKMSPIYDIKIILKTIPVMMFSRGGK